MLIKRVACLVLLILGLASCSQHEEYAYLISHPEALHANLARCNAGQLKPNSDICQDARLVKQVLDQYFALQSTVGESYYKAQQQYLDIENKLKTITNLKRRKELLKQQQAIMENDEQVYLIVQENFGKLIMAEESKLAALKTRRLTLQQKLRANQGSADQLRIQLKTAEQRISKTQQTIQVMLTLVGLNGG